jgi:hypothetical protein
MPVLAWVISLTLSRREVRLSVNWVNVEWDSTSTETARSETSRQLSQRRKHQHLWSFYHSALTQLMWSLTLRWISWCGVSLGVDSVDKEWDSASTESPLNVKKIWIIRQIQEQNRKNSEALLFGLYVFDMCKKRGKKKSLASVPLRCRSLICWHWINLTKFNLI